MSKIAAAILVLILSASMAYGQKKYGSWTVEGEPKGPWSATMDLKIPANLHVDVSELRKDNSNELEYVHIWLKTWFENGYTLSLEFNVYPAGEGKWEIKYLIWCYQASDSHSCEPRHPKPDWWNRYAQPRVKDFPPALKKYFQGGEIARQLAEINKNYKGGEIYRKQPGQ